jgi:hypothetical protein
MILYQKTFNIITPTIVVVVYNMYYVHCCRKSNKKELYKNIFSTI